MFYKLIEKKRDEWLNSDECVIADIISYIERQHKMRDAQIESIKTYLFLKIKCKNKPLWELLSSGEFNTTNVDELEINRTTREILTNNPAALALWEFASIEDENGKANAPQILNAIRNNPNGIDYIGIIKKLFYNVSYPDYLFSIPMGAGKTYLMAAFIYLNLYFAMNEPDNELFAHNFLILVPSNLKSSIIPSLKDIQNFNPLWIFPEPVASQLKSIIKYEWLQDNSSASKSNTVKNPNARKINMHLSDQNLIGLIAVTNAEKVILDRIDNSTNIDSSLLKALNEAERKEYEATKQANELREQIGFIPNLCILIDEVHHASDEQKLRQVVNGWMKQSNFNSVLGFSGTPNMNPALKVPIYGGLSVKCSQFANVVTYYPLIKAIGNFLKVPSVRYSDMNSSNIISEGLKEFFGKYQNTVYTNGISAKIAIYAPSISVLEEEVYPEVCSVCSEIGIDFSTAILKYHKGNADYSVDNDAQYEFSILDSPMSRKRIVLLVGIGREGWNCKSLTGIIIPQISKSTQNNVLQISCRCLREVDNANTETALIWLNKSNAEILNKQLEEQQYTTLKEFGSQHATGMREIHRYSRTEKLQLPPFEFCQLKISYDTIEINDNLDVKSFLESYEVPYLDEQIVYTQDFENIVASETISNYGYVNNLSFRAWIDLIVKEGFGTISINDLRKYFCELHNLYFKIICNNEVGEYLNPKVNQMQVRSDIRKCFTPKRDFKIKEDLVPEDASLLKIEALKSPINVPQNQIYVPTQEKVKEIIDKDKNPPQPISEEIRAYLIANNLPLPEIESSVNDRTYQYIPYHLDSPLEKSYLEIVLNHLKTIPNIEFYFNGDETLSNFRIRCYRKNGNKWKKMNDYYPDFIMLTRAEDNTIDKIVIIETKGEGFAGKFEPRKKFMEEIFIKKNNEYYGRERFSFLYIEDTEAPVVQLQKTIRKINSFLLNS